MPIKATRALLSAALDGTATTEAKYKPYEAPQGRSSSTILYVVIGLVVLVMAAWFLLHSSGL